MPTETEALIVDIFEESCRIHGRAPNHSKDPEGFQSFARAQRLFVIEGGIRAMPANTSAAGRKRFSRLRLELEGAGLIRITRVGPTSTFLALTAAGLAMAEKLTGKRAPADLRKATKAMAATSNN